MLKNVKVEYEVLPGWDEDLSDCKEWDDLPTNAQVYVRRVEVRSATVVVDCDRTGFLKVKVTISFE